MGMNGHGWALCMPINGPPSMPINDAHLHSIGRFMPIFDPPEFIVPSRGQTADPPRALQPLRPCSLIHLLPWNTPVSACSSREADPAGYEGAQLPVSIARWLAAADAYSRARRLKREPAWLDVGGEEEEQGSSSGP